jgi:RimJ/RimL family protein N-acetyltransferase
MRNQTFLRRAEREDLDTIVSWMQDPDYLRFLYGDPAQSPKQIRENIVSMLGRSQANLLPSSIHLVIDHKTEGPIGLVSLQKISWRNRACVVDFYMGNKGLRGRMESGAAMYRMAEYCFDELNLHRITAFIYLFNSPSWRLLERCGAIRELTLKEHVVRDGDLCDMYCYGLLREDFQAFRDGETQLDGFTLEAMIESLSADDAGGAPS